MSKIKYHYTPPKNAPITNQTLVDDLLSVCESLGVIKLSQKVYEENGKFSVATYKKRFGTWNNALELAGLEITKQLKKIPLDDLVNDLKHISNKLNGKNLTQDIYRQYGRYDVKTYKIRFGTWNNALKKAGLEVSAVGKYSIEELFENILTVWNYKGAQPRQGDIDNKKISRISVSSYKYRFGSWSKALNAFIERMNNDNAEVPKEESTRIMTKETKGKKQIKVGDRYKVLKRDNFTCVKCGASPAKNPGEVELQVDHKTPESLGGSTHIDNFQTLCKKCNLGKGNRFID